MKNLVPACNRVIPAHSLTEKGAEENKNIKPGLSSEGNLADEIFRQTDESYNRNKEGRRKVD